MKLLKILLETYKDEYELNLKEGLIKTTNIGKTTHLLKKYFPTFSILRPNKESNTFKIEIDDPNVNNVKELLTLSNNLGWFPSFFRYKTKDDRLSVDKWNDRIINILNELESITIDFEAKFDEEIVEKTPDVLYHIASKQSADKILKIGLVPKSRSKASYHPDRVFLAKTEKWAEDLGKAFYQKTGVKEWVILKINTTLIPGGYFKLYSDPNYKEKGYYTLNNIPPQAIEKVKDINL